MAEGRDWAAVCMAPVIRRETSSPFQVVPVRKESPGRITASFELSVPPNPITNSGDLRATPSQVRCPRAGLLNGRCFAPFSVFPAPIA